MRLEKRNHTSPAAYVLAPVGAVVFTLLVSALLVLWAGAPVGQTYALLLQGAFGSVFALTETLTRATPLILTGLAAAVAFRARLFNIGAEGQLYAGALAAVAVGGMHGGTGLEWSPYVLFPLMMLAAALAGAALLLGPALMKARLGVDEVVTTLLLNFIMLLLVSALLDGPMKDPLSMGWPQSVALQGDLELSKLVPQTRLHTGLLWAVSLAVRAGQQRSQFNEHAEALYLTSSFVFESAAQAAARFSGEDPGNVYSRFTNPTVTAFEERLAALEPLLAVLTWGSPGDTVGQRGRSGGSDTCDGDEYVDDSGAMRCCHDVYPSFVQGDCRMDLIRPGWR